MIDLSALSSTSLLDGVFENELPEYYALRSIVENNAWHDNQDVFSHSVKVFEGLELVLKGGMFSESTRVALRKRLDTMVDDFSREDLLKIATLLHDISKLDTLFIHEDGSMSCPGHEFLSAAWVDRFADRFGLSGESLSAVEFLVSRHGFVGQMMGSIYEHGHPDHFSKIFFAGAKDWGVELLLFMHADAHGSDLDQLDVEKLHRFQGIIVELVEKNIS